ncbi:NAD-dependent epimerase/dehydratase family protein [Piscinibacter sakaiensis]|uniref:Isoflavone reductase n=1 Tax=Piscinibacter sakaiensis TaxID=1547922 RepID=A0A0K8P228_PISS1|nr:NAD-dependent epimerase/dehydratase family protein [Piscinibacter sakaiensis]GAP36686.1 isoflavone reductase [Piscinibacter sakaiensis]
MKLLLIGGGAFLGRALLDAACAAGHAVTVFNRGRRRRDWPPGVEWIEGDRRQDLARLAGRHWDAVADTCGYLPPEVAASAAALRGCGRYLFVSSVSAYAALDRPGLDETAALASAASVAPDDADLAHYGAQKAACEAAVQAVFGDRSQVVRPGLIVGPGDPTGRASHWPWRLAEGGRTVAPDAPAATLQCIDVRDLAAWMLRLLERPGGGCWNATGPSIGWADWLAACAAAVRAQGGTPAEVVAVPEAALEAAGVAPWSGLPLWIPSTAPNAAGFMAVSRARALADGLVTRPAADTAADILRLDPAGPGDPRRAGRISAAQEAALLGRD